MGPGQLRPLTIGETLDAAIGVVRDGAGTMARLVSVAVLPSLGLGVLVLLSMIPAADTTAPGAVVSGGMLVMGTLAMATQVFATGACTHAALATYLAEPGTPAPGWREAGARFGAVLGLTLIMTVPVAAGMFFCYLAGIALMALWSCAIPALIAEDLGPMAALRRSQALVKARFWPTTGSIAGAYLLFETVLMGVVGVLAIVLLLVLTPSSPAGVVAVLAVIWYVATLLTTPFVAAVSTVVYVDLRVRREGLDVQYLIQAMDRPPAPGLAAPSPPAAVSTPTSATPSGLPSPTGPSPVPAGPSPAAPWRRDEPPGARR